MPRKKVQQTRNHRSNGHHRESIDERVTGYLKSAEKVRWDTRMEEIRVKENNPKLSNGDMFRRFLGIGLLSKEDEPPRQTPARE